MENTVYCKDCIYSISAGYGEINCDKILKNESRNPYNHDLIAKTVYGITKMNKTGKCKYFRKG
jgi:hypothetical protein